MVMSSRFPTLMKNGSLCRPYSTYLIFSRRSRRESTIWFGEPVWSRPKLHSSLPAGLYQSEVLNMSPW